MIPNLFSYTHLQELNAGGQIEVKASLKIRIWGESKIYIYKVISQYWNLLIKMNKRIAKVNIKQKNVDNSKKTTKK